MSDAAAEPMPTADELKSLGTRTYIDLCRSIIAKTLLGLAADDAPQGTETGLAIREAFRQMEAYKALAAGQGYDIDIGAVWLIAIEEGQAAERAEA